MKRKLLWCAALSVAVLSACSEDQTGKDVIHTVMLTSPQGGETELSKVVAGTIEEAREINVSFRTYGPIAKMAVKEGDYVREGQLIAQLDDKDVKLNVESLQVQYDQLKREVERLTKLQKSHSISGNDYDKAVSGLRQLEVNLQAQKNVLEYTRLCAPASGYVKKVNFEVSEMVNAGTPVITLLDTRRMEVVCDIPAALYLQREKIVSASCSGRFSGGNTVALSIVSYAPKADVSQLYRMRMVLDKPATENISGQNVEVRLQLSDDEGSTVLTVPMASVVNENSQTYVMEFQPLDSTIHRKPVVLGEMKTEGRVEVKSGLSGKELIVKAGVIRVKDGEKVRVVE